MMHPKPQSRLWMGIVPAWILTILLGVLSAEIFLPLPAMTATPVTEEMKVASIRKPVASLAAPDAPLQQPDVTLEPSVRPSEEVSPPSPTAPATETPASIVVFTPTAIPSPSVLASPEPTETTALSDEAAPSAAAFSPPSPTPTTLPTAVADAVVIAPNGLNVRNGPGLGYDPPVGFLPPGETLRVLGAAPGGEWIQVEAVALHVSGWVFAARSFIELNVELDMLPAIYTSSPTPTLPPSPSPSLVQVTAAPSLIDPQPSASQHKNRMDLEWDWEGALGPDDYFQVEIRNRYNAFLPEIDEHVSPIDVAWVKDKFYRYDVIDEAYDREYTWRIMVVRGHPVKEKQWSTADIQVWDPAPKFEIISQPSEMRTLYVEPGDQPPPLDDNKGENGGGPGPGCRPTC